MGSVSLLTERLRLLAAAAVLSAGLIGAAVQTANADGPSLSGSIWRLTSGDTIDSKETVTDNLTQNYYFSLNRTINPVFSYRLNLRAYIQDKDLLEPQNIRTNSRTLSIEPAVDFFLKNPMYNLTLGYRHTEKKSSTNLVASNLPADFFYARYNLTLEKYPRLTLMADRKAEGGNSGLQTTDKTTTTYSASSSYQTGYKGLNLFYYALYRRSDEETPLSALQKRIDEKINGRVILSYGRSFLGNRISVSAQYQGNYLSSSLVQTAQVTGTFVTGPFTPLFGGYAPGTALQPGAETLQSDAALTDGNLAGPDGAIDLGSGQYHNIGISVPSTSVVDRLFLYVNADLSGDETNLGCGSGCAFNWRIYMAAANVPSAIWTEIPLQRADLKAHDAQNNIYYYELIFSAPQSSATVAYFKAVNMALASPSNPLISTLPVTEIEARGSETLVAGVDNVKDTLVVSQGISLGTTVRPLPSLSLNLQYTLNRIDTDPESIAGALSGIFEDLFSRPGGNPGIQADINVFRNYGASASWRAHRLLTVTGRYFINESFDRAGSFDFSSTTYGLGFKSSPLPTLDATLTLTRTESFSFSLPAATNDSAVLSLAARLYENVTMQTDIGYTSDLVHATGITSASEYITGQINAVLTPRLNADARYSLRWSGTGGARSASHDTWLNLRYRPGRFLSLTARLRVEGSGAMLKLTQGLSIDWIPVKTVRAGLIYQRTTDDMTRLNESQLTAYASWKVTKFMEAGVNYTLLNKKDIMNVQNKYTLGLNLNCRF